MTNNEHNEKVLAEVSKLNSQVEDLLETLKPADPIVEMTLQECNAGALAARMAKFGIVEEVEPAKAKTNAKAKS